MGRFDPPAATHAVDTGLRTFKGHAIMIRKVKISEPLASEDEEYGATD